jgi:hypothetical protein
MVNLPYQGGDIWKGNKMYQLHPLGATNINSMDNKMSTRLQKLRSSWLFFFNCIIRCLGRPFPFSAAVVIGRILVFDTTFCC